MISRPCTWCIYILYRYNTTYTQSHKAEGEYIKTCINIVLDVLYKMRLFSRYATWKVVVICTMYDALFPYSIFTHTHTHNDRNLFQYNSNGLRIGGEKCMCIYESWCVPSEALITRCWRWCARIFYMYNTETKDSTLYFCIDFHLGSLLYVYVYLHKNHTPLSRYTRAHAYCTDSRIKSPDVVNALGKYDTHKVVELAMVRSVDASSISVYNLYLRFKTWGRTYTPYRYLYNVICRIARIRCISSTANVNLAIKSVSFV